MLSALLILSAAPATTVVLPFSRADEYPTEKAMVLALRVSAALEQLGVGIAVPPDRVDVALAKAGAPALGTCAGHKECLPTLGRALQLFAVVGLHATEVGSDLGIHLELIGSDDGRKLAKASVVLPVSSDDAALETALKPFAAKLKPALMAAPPRPDAPVAKVEPVLVPTVEQPAQEVPDVKTYGTGTIALAGGTAVVAAAAGGLAIAGLLQQNALGLSTDPAGQLRSTQTVAQAQSHVNQANTLYTGALITAGVGAAMLAATTYLFTR